jgi:hypothetical protein
MDWVAATAFIAAMSAVLIFALGYRPRKRS